MANEIMGSVTIIYNTEGQHQLIPELGLLDRHVQTMQWTLVAPAGFRFEFPGIVFNPPPPLPEGFSPWPGGEIIRENDCQLRASVNFPAPDGQPQKYRYDIWINRPGDTGEIVEKMEFVSFDPERVGQKIDPDMENDPKP